MNKKQVYDDYIIKLTKRYNKIFNDNKDILLESCIEYFGEEYRKVFTERFNTIVFNFEFSKQTYEMFDYILEQYDLAVNHTQDIIKQILNVKKLTKKQLNMLYSSNVKESGLYNFSELDINKQLEFLKQLLNTNKIDENTLEEMQQYSVEYYYYSKIIEDIYPINELKEYQDCIDFDHVIYSSDVLEDEELRKPQLEYAGDSGYHISSIGKKRYLYFLIGRTTDNTIIHEVIHSLLCSKLYQDGKYISYKVGLKTNENSEANGLEEVLTVEDAEKITDIFHRRGGNICGIMNEVLKYTEESITIDLYPLVENLYKKYNKILNKARLLENSNLLFKYFYKEVYNEYIEIINLLLKAEEANEYMGDEHQDNIITQEAIDYINELLSEIEIFSKEEMTIEEYQELYPNKKMKILNK